MHFSTKFASILFPVMGSALLARSAFVPTHSFAEVSVVFFDDIDFLGASYSPPTLVQGACSTLPGDWLDRAESVTIGAGFRCTFYELQGCEGPATALTGNVEQLPVDTLYNNIESFICSKAL